MGAAIAEPESEALPRRLCLALDQVLEARGSVLVLMAHLSHHRVLAASDTHTARLGELEFSLGEGPGLDAVARCTPVRVGDLAGDDGDRWPALAVTVADVGLPVRAVFAFPLQLSGVSFGVLEVHRDRPGDLDETDAANGRIATGRHDRRGGPRPPPGPVGPHRPGHHPPGGRLGARRDHHPGRAGHAPPRAALSNHPPPNAARARAPSPTFDPPAAPYGCDTLLSWGDTKQVGRPDILP